MNFNKFIDISTEFQLMRYRHGIQLIRPDITPPYYKDTEYTVGSILQLPLCIHFSDKHSTIKHLNEATAVSLWL